VVVAAAMNAAAATLRHQLQESHAANTGYKFPHVSAISHLRLSLTVYDTTAPIIRPKPRPILFVEG
jgi:hypothetical protein